MSYLPPYCLISPPSVTGDITMGYVKKVSSEISDLLCPISDIFEISHMESGQCLSHPPLTLVLACHLGVANNAILVAEIVIS